MDGARAAGDPPDIVTAGEQFAKAIATKDRAGLMGILNDPIDFRALTPQQYWETTSVDELVDQIVLGRWFEPNDHILELCSVVAHDLGGRRHVAYQMRVRNGGAEYVVEQQAYYRVRQGRIDWLRILCSGFLPLSDSA